MSYVKEKTKNYLMKFNKIPPLTTTTATRARALRAAIPPINVPKGNVTTTDTAFIARDGAQIPVRIYTPIQQGNTPVIVYYHGGGWVLNDLTTCDVSCSLLAEQTQSIVVSVAYRLAPEYKFPIPLYDAFDAMQWVKQNIAYNRELIVAGDSAGGNLAAAVTLLAKEQAIQIDGQILLYPVTDLSYSSASYDKYGQGFGLDKDVMKWFGDYYIRSEEDTKNPYVAPLLADVTGLPRALIVVAENDVLRDEGKAYAEKLEAAGVPVTFTVAEGLVHSYFTKNDTFAEEIDETIALVKSFLQK